MSFRLRNAGIGPAYSFLLLLLLKPESLKKSLCRLTVLFVLVFFAVFFAYTLYAQNELFAMRVVNPSYQLNSAWELTWGPDDSLWVTENNAYVVSKLSPADGGKTLLLDISALRDFTNPPIWPQGGLMGMALHPTMYSEWPNPSKPWVYLAYVYHYAASIRLLEWQRARVILKPG